MANEPLDPQEESTAEPEVNETFGAELDGKSPKKKSLPVSPATLMLVGMAVIGVAAVYVLRMRVGPEAASAEQVAAETRVDAALMVLQAGAPAAEDTASVVDTFYYEAAERQVPPWQLEGNPFVFEAPKPREEQTASYQNPAGMDTRSPQGVANTRQQMARAMQAVRELQLESVLMGPREPMAMVSSNLLAKGQMIEGWTVAEIRPREVVLTWGTETHVLMMAE